MIKPIGIAAILTGTLACNGDRVHDASPPAAASPSSAAPAADDGQSAAGASFQATLSGATEQTLEGTGSVAGAKYGRYHINLASQGGRACLPSW